MAIPRIPRRWRLRTLMAVVAACAVGLVAYRYVERWPVYRELLRLRRGSAGDRADAALRIGLLGRRASFAAGALESALGDPDRPVRTNAAYSLVRLGSRSPRLLPILAAQFEDTPRPIPGYHPRAPVTWRFLDPPRGSVVSDGGLYDNDPIDALKMIRPEAAAFVPMLEKALKSPDRWVRAAALEALFAVANWSDPSGRELADALLVVLDEHWRDPRTQEPDAYGPFWDRQRAVQALARLDRAAQERAVAALARDLRDLGSPRSFEAALLLPRLEGGTATAASILRDLARGGDETRCRIAMILLEPIGEAAAPLAPDVMRVITGPGADRKINLRGRLDWWESLVGREGPGFRRFVEGTARGETTAIAPGVRALRAMGASVERRAIPDLIAMVRQPGGDPGRNRRAIIALGEFGPSAAGAIPALAGVIRAQEEADGGPPGGFADPDSPGALATAALGRIAAEGNPEALAILAGLIETPRWAVGHQATWALLQLGPKARPAVPALVKALKDPRQVVRSHSAEALREVGAADVRAVIPALMAAMDDENEVVRNHAMRTLSEYGAEAKAAVPKMVERLWDSGPGADVARSLGRIGPGAADAVPALLVSLEMTVPNWQRDEIREALDRIMPRTSGATVEGSIGAMKSEDPSGRYHAAYELGRLIEGMPTGAEIIAALGGAIDDTDPRVRRMAVVVLGRLGARAEPARPALIRATRDRDQAVRKLAAWGLVRTAPVRGRPGPRR